MYNYYLEQNPIDVTPHMVCEKAEQNTSSAGLLSALSGIFSNGNNISSLFTEDNLIILGAIAFLTYGENGFDKELIALSALFLLMGL